MAVEVVIPVLGLTVEKGKILKWLKSEGEPVQKGESIFEVEADKVTTEVECPASGILKRILIQENVEVPVLTVVAVIAEKGEELTRTYEAPNAPQITATRANQTLPSKAKENYDIAIIGAGPGGYISAIRAAQMGANVLLVEKDELGGTCLNRGCIPTKSLLSDVKVLRKVRASDLFVNGSNLSIDAKKMASRKNGVIETMKKGISVLLERQGVKVVKGSGTLLDSNLIQVSQNGRKESYRAEHLIIATGSRASLLSTIKRDGHAVLTSDEVLGMEEIPEELLIIGGGVIGVEFATIYRGLGAKVTILEMLPQIISTEDEEISRGLKLLMEREGIKILTGAKVLQASPARGKVNVTFEIDGKKEVITTQKVILAVGRDPNTEMLNLEKIGVRLEKKFIKVNSRMETNVEGVYAIGDVIGKMMLAHAASAEGIIAVENSRGKSREIDYHRIPSCIYTFPEVASVGLKESEAKMKGYNVCIGKSPYLYSGKALTMGETEGFVKIIAERESGEILGVHILGESATDLIGECLVGMNAEIAIEELSDVVKGHPTLSEIIMEAALDCDDRAIHIPKKA
jgi:dihydrolipoamide dehydrogenase